jgi:hypothetical protein
MFAALLTFSVALLVKPITRFHLFFLSHSLATLGVNQSAVTNRHFTTFDLIKAIKRQKLLNLLLIVYSYSHRSSFAVFVTGSDRFFPVIRMHFKLDFFSLSSFSIKLNKDENFLFHSHVF